MHTTDTAISGNIRALMARNGVTQADLSTVLGIPQSQVSSRLRGRVDWRAGELVKVAEVLGVPASTLLEVTS